MGNIRQRLYWEWLQIRGNAKWQAIWSFIEPYWEEWVLPYWKGLLGAVVSMTGTAIAYFWEWVTGLHPLVIFFILFGIYVLVWALVAFVVFIFRGGKQIPPASLHITEKLQTKLTDIDDIQPCLIADHFSEPRIIPLGRQPEPPSHPILFKSMHEESHVSLAFLRITNRPNNHNMQAIAHNVYAWISYCDSKWNNLFPPLPGVWLTPQSANDPYEIGAPFSEIGPLKPNDFAYLGIAIGEIFADKFSPDIIILHAAITASSTQWRSWLHGDFMLDKRTENGDIYVKVIIGCHGYETTYSYLLKQQIAGNESGLVLVPVS